MYASTSQQRQNTPSTSNVRVFSSASFSNPPVSDEDSILETLKKDVAELKADKLKLRKDIEVLKADLKQHLDNCSSNSNHTTLEKKKIERTKVFLTTFLNCLEVQMSQPIFFMEEIKTEPSSILAHLQSFMQQRVDFQKESLEDEKLWTLRLRKIIGARRNRFASHLREKVLSILNISKKVVPWHFEEELEAVNNTNIESEPEVVLKNKKRSRAQVEEHDSMKEQELIRKKSDFKSVFREAVTQQHWNLTSLVLYSLLKLDKYSIQSTAYACIVLDKFQFGEKLEKNTGSPAGWSTYFTNILDLQKNKSPFPDCTTALDEMLQKVKTM